MSKRIIVLLTVAALGTVAYMMKGRIMSYFNPVQRTVNTTEKRLLFREDPTFSELKELLVQEGIVLSAEGLNELAVEQSIDTNSFAAGKYIVLSGTTLTDLLDGFVKDENGNGKREVKVNVVFNRCKTIEDVGSNISKCIVADSASLVNHILDPATLTKYHFTKEQMPALFLPDEYEMYFDTDPEEFVSFMADKFKEFWNEERMVKLQEVGLKYPSQATTLASIVYSEQSQLPEEWPDIAGLYLNRLKLGMRLESDPTFKFCWGDKLDGVERLLNVHREIDCPYNTYKINGLPPGPICIPPASVIDAVLNPAKHNYIFMCGKPGGTGHNYAVTNAEHERNVAVYRKWLKEYLKNKNR